MSLFPLFLKLEGRRCLVVGAGVVAESKIQSLVDAGAEVHVVAPAAIDAIQQWAHAGTVSWEQRSFTNPDLDGVFIVITATSSEEVNQTIFEEARRRGILCNSVDDPEHCDFYYGAVVRRGDLQIAISTAGHSPALAQRIRRQLETQFGPEYFAWVRRLGETRKRLFESDIDPEKRKAELHRIASQEAFESERFLTADGERANFLGADVLAQEFLAPNLLTKEQGSL